MQWKKLTTALGLLVIATGFSSVPGTADVGATASCDSAMNDLLNIYPEKMVVNGSIEDNLQEYWAWNPEFSIYDDVESAATDVVSNCSVDDWSNEDEVTSQDSHSPPPTERCEHVFTIPLKCIESQSRLHFTDINDCDGVAIGWKCFLHESRGMCRSSYDDGICLLEAEFMGTTWRVENKPYGILTPVIYAWESEEFPRENTSRACGDVWVDANMFTDAHSLACNG